MTYELKYPVELCPISQSYVSHCQSLALYYDASDQWESVYPKRSMTCQQKTSSDVLDIDQLLYLDPWKRYAIQDGNFGVTEACSLTDNDTMVYCNSTRSFRSVRPRWWYIVLTNCDRQPSGLYLFSYKFTLLNGNSYQKHFSYDEFFILETDAAAVFLFLLLMAFTTFSSVKLYNGKLLHPTYVMYLFSIVLKTLSWIVLLAAYLYYQSGDERVPLKRFGSTLAFLAYFTLLTVLLLIAKGYTVTRGSLPPKEKWFLIPFLLFYFIVYIGAALW